MRQTQEGILIRFATMQDTPAVIRLWETCFPGDTVFQNYFFAHLYVPEYNLLLFRNDVLCAMAQMLPYRMQDGWKTETVTYIYGACTYPDYRRQHLMDTLLHHTFMLDRQMGRDASILIPQEEWLFGFYAQFGYEAVLSVSADEYHAVPGAECCPLRAMVPEDLSGMDALYHAALPEGAYLCRDEAEWKKQLDLFTHCGGGAFCTGAEGEPEGYAFVWHTKQEGLWAQELCAPGKTMQFAGALMAHFGVKKCRATGLSFSQKQLLGCVLRHDGARPTDGYINLMLN